MAFQVSGTFNIVGVVPGQNQMGLISDAQGKGLLAEFVAGDLVEIVGSQYNDGVYAVLSKLSDSAMSTGFYFSPNEIQEPCTLVGYHVGDPLYSIKEGIMLGRR